MATGKNIEIRIAATGGAQAAAEIGKVEDATKGLDASTVKITDTTRRNTAGVEENKRALAEWQAVRNAARQGGGESGLAVDPAEMEAEEAAAKAAKTAETKKAIAAAMEEARATRQLREEQARAKQSAQRLREEQKSLTAAMRDGNRAAANKRRGVEGLTSAMSGAGARSGALGAALRALVSPYALIGSAIGFVIAGITRWMGKSREHAAAEQAAAQKIADAYEALRAKSIGLATAQAGLENQAFIDSLDDEEEGIRRLNEELKRNIELAQSRRRLQMEMVSADAAYRQAQVDASDMPEAEKILARARIQDEVDRQQRDNRTADAGDKAAAEETLAADGAAKAARKAADAEALRQRLAEQEAEANAQRGLIRRAEIARKSLPGAEAAAGAAAAELAAGESLGQFGSGAARMTPRQIEALREKAAAAEAELERTRDAANRGGDPKRLAKLEGAGGEIAITKKGIEDSETAAEDLAAAAQALAAKAALARQQAEDEIRAAQVIYERRAGTRGITAGVSAVRAAEADRAREAAQKAAAERAAAKAALDQDRAGRDRLAEEKAIGREARSIIPKGASDRLRNAIEAAAQGLQDGDQGGEIEKLADMVSRLAQAAEKSQSATAAQKIKLAQLEARIKEL